MSKKKELTEEEKRKNFSDLIFKKYKKGKIIFSTIDGFMEADLDNIVNCQPVEGLLYDLNRDLVTCLSWVEHSDDIVWVNNTASGIVIEYMAKQISNLHVELKKWKYMASALYKPAECFAIEHPLWSAPNGEKQDPEGANEVVEKYKNLIEKEQE